MMRGFVKADMATDEALVCGSSGNVHIDDADGAKGSMQVLLAPAALAARLHTDLQGSGMLGIA